MLANLYIYALLAGVVDFKNYTSAEGISTPPQLLNGYPDYNTKLRLMSFQECGVPLHFDYSYIHLKLFNHLLRIIIITYLKSYSFVKIICIR